jgi:myo-inositol 2-dehydrogenase / D-chiro-inositol 1-dehydrogenase
MPDKPTTIAVLGCGRIGRMHARLLARHPAARLALVYDVVPAAAADTAAELSVPAAANVDSILAEPSIDAVLIATPTNTHVDLIISAVRAGKAVFCEKPIDLDMERVLRCKAAIEPFGAPVMIGFNRRFDPSFRAIRDRVQSGEIGRLEQIVITSRDPSPPPASYVKVSGGLFRDMTIHDFDMARYIAGDIALVHAIGANLVDPAIQAEGDIDAAMVVLKATSGALIHINNSRRCAYGYDQRLEVFGSQGMLLAGNQRPTSVSLFNATATASSDLVMPFFIERYAAAYAAEIDHFISCVKSKGKPLASFSDGVAALRIAEAAQRSLESGLPQALT